MFCSLLNWDLQVTREKYSTINEILPRRYEQRSRRRRKFYQVGSQLKCPDRSKRRTKS
ncbi:unnamed protein product [Tenebrio molitor]|nr:unnamed protein product [Tenebrio molitor]